MALFKDPNRDREAHRRIDQLERQVARLQAALEQLGNASGVSMFRLLEEKPEEKLRDVAELARSGKKIEAVKRYREITGAGLKEAKGYVDKL